MKGKQYVSVWSGIGGWIGLPVIGRSRSGRQVRCAGCGGLANANGFDKIPTGGALFTFRVDTGESAGKSVAKN